MNPSRPRTSCGLIAITAILAALCAGVPTFYIGQLLGYLRAENARGDRDVQRVTEIVEAHPDEFGTLTINRGPLDKFLLEGTVKSRDDLDLLREEMIRAFGEDRADYILAVEVDASSGGETEPNLSGED
jgi:hypothetical protein